MVNSRALVAAMAELSRTATGDFAVEEMLRALCVVAGQALPVDGAGVMLRRGERNVFVHGTTMQVQPVERLQEVLQAGPCADSLRGQAPVAVADLREVGDWGDYRALSAELGLGSVLAVPLLSRGRGWGVLDLYRRVPGPWTAPELGAARALADVAVSYMVMAHDRDDARTAHLALAHRAMHDDLTGLANRALLFDRLDHALATAGRRQAGVAVLFCDLDLFKGINDTFGHTAADAVLVEVAGRLTASLRGGDTVARFAGDEFVLVCEGLPQEPPDALAGRVGALTSRLQRALRRPIRIGPVDVVVSASIGVVIGTDDMTAQDLLADADTAMYAAKQQGRGRAVVRNPTVLSAVGYVRQLERTLAGALDRDELAVHYQPIVHAGSGELAAVEALLRWQHPDGVLLPASAFIDVAVKTGMIVAIGRWVIEQACRQMAGWQHTLGARAPATVFVNLSRPELADPQLPQAITAALARHHLHPAQLGLEIVEDDLADPATVTRLETYARRGHPLSVDDFGTGYSSLSRLLDLPVNHVKIDKAFVAGIPADTRRTRVIDGILVMASALDITVVAEGVENDAQAAHLAAAGCQLLQGHHIGSTAPADRLTTTWTATP